SGPSTKRTVARGLDALQDYLKHFQTISALGEADPDRGLEPPLDELVQHPDDAVELRDIEVLEQHPTDEVHVAVGSDREVRAVRACGASGASVTRADPDSVAAHEPARHEIAVETAKSPCGHAPRVAGRSRGRAGTHLTREDLVGEQARDGRREVVGVAAVDEE